VDVISQGEEEIKRKNIWVTMQSTKMGKNKKKAWRTNCLNAH
jgi:hypothetical protein